MLLNKGAEVRWRKREAYKLIARTRTRMARMIMTRTRTEWVDDYSRSRVDPWWYLLRLGGSGFSNLGRQYRQFDTYYYLGYVGKKSAKSHFSSDVYIQYIGITPITLLNLLCLLTKKNWISIITPSYVCPLKIHITGWLDRPQFLRKITQPN